MNGLVRRPHSTLRGCGQLRNEAIRLQCEYTLPLVKFLSPSGKLRGLCRRIRPYVIPTRPMRPTLPPADRTRRETGAVTSSCLSLGTNAMPPAFNTQPRHFTERFLRFGDGLRTRAHALVSQRKGQDSNLKGLSPRPFTASGFPHVGDAVAGVVHGEMFRPRG